MAKFTENPVSRQRNIVVQELSGEVLIYDLNVNRAFCLNATSALVWSLCDGNRSVLEISREVSKRLKDSVSEDLIWLAIDQLNQENLLANGDRIETFDFVSRREVIKKIGLASIIALPIISSITAPTAAMAASPGACGNTNASCVTNTDCSTIATALLKPASRIRAVSADACNSGFYMELVRLKLRTNYSLPIIAEHSKSALYEIGFLGVVHF